MAVRERAAGAASCLEASQHTTAVDCSDLDFSPCVCGKNNTGLTDC